MQNLHVLQTVAPTICKAGCICKKGFVLDTLSNTCVEAKKCPCHHGGRSYNDGDIIKEKCNDW
jgi:von Willebrand factor